MTLTVSTWLNYCRNSRGSRLNRFKRDKNRRQKDRGYRSNRKQSVKLKKRKRKDRNRKNWNWRGKNNSGGKNNWKRHKKKGKNTKKYLPNKKRRRHKLQCLLSRGQSHLLRCLSFMNRSNRSQIRLNWIRKMRNSHSRLYLYQHKKINKSQTRRKSMSQ